MLIAIGLTILCLGSGLLGAASVAATTYYVSPTGDDSFSGLSADSAWLAIDNGESLSILAPGDTVNILPGTYLPTAMMKLDTDGSTGSPIVYRKFGEGDVTVDIENQDFVVFELNGNHTWIEGLEITDSRKPAIDLKADSCVIRACYIHDIDDMGVKVSGDYGLFERNVIAEVTGNGIEIDAKETLFYGNTVYNSGGIGISFKVKATGSRCFNNISIGHDEGIRGKDDVIAGFNLLRLNADDYTDGISDSAGGLTSDPDFVNAAGGDFNLEFESPAIDAGLDLGYSFLYEAPDIGAMEWQDELPILTAIGPRSVDEDKSLKIGVSATDAESTPTLSTSTLPDGATFEDKGNGTGDLDWIPTFVQAGSYEITFYATDDALQVDSEVVTITVNEVGNQLPVMTSIGNANILDNERLQFTAEATDAESIPVMTATGLPAGASYVDNGDGTADFDWTPPYPSAGNHNLTFYATDDSLAVDSQAVLIHVNAAVTTSIEVTPDIATISADSTLQFAATGYDAGGYEANPGIITWELTEPIGTIDTDGLFTATTTGTAKVVATSSLGPVDTTSYLAVTASGLTYLTISPDSAEITADSSINFTSTGMDADSNATGVGTLTWEVLGGVGTIDADGLFTPGSAGTGQIAATSSVGGVVDTNTAIIVVPGVLATLTITPDRDTVSTDSTRQFAIFGSDVGGNAVGDLGTLTWSVDGGIGTIDNAGLFQANATGSGFVNASSSYGPTDKTDSIFVVPGDVAYINVAPATNTIGEGDSFEYEAYSYDADSNLVGTITNSATWTTNDATGSIDATGDYTAGTNVSPPNLYVYADFATFRDSSEVTVISSGSLSYVQIENENGTVFGDTTMTTDNDTTVLHCRSYDSDDNLLGDVSVNWSLIDVSDIGSRAPAGGTSTTISLTAPGTLRVVSRHASGLEDTTGTITVTAGIPAILVLAPDEATLSTGDNLQFTYESLDADSNASVPAIVGSWSVLGGIGSITEFGGLFTPETAGDGNIVVTGGGLADTSSTITVTSGGLNLVTVSPDSVRVGIGDTVQFTATGYDDSMNETDAGELTWKLVGWIGTVDSEGLFIATQAGTAAVAATSNIGGIADTTRMLAVEELVLTTIPLGNSLTYPGQLTSPLLSYRLDNYFDDARTIDKFTVRTNFGGSGNNTQKLTNVDSLLLYLDTDNDSVFSAGDSLLMERALSSSSTEFDIDPLEISAGSGYTFIVAGRTALYPRDGDTLDLYLRSNIDVTVEGGTLVAGPDSANSYGAAVVDGMLADQISVATTGVVAIADTDSIFAVMALDIPKNGYATDTLRSFTVVNSGTATAADLDSLILFEDDGNAVWDGPSTEIALGRMYFTGAEWSLTGLTSELLNPQNRYYVAADVNQFAAASRTIVLDIPIGGLEMESANDGPIDAPVYGVDTITINSDERVTVAGHSQSERILVPGEISDPIFTVRMDNGYATPMGVDSIVLSVALADPRGASQAQLDSQIDSLLLYLDRDNDPTAVSASDSLIGTAQVTNGVAVLPVNGMLLSAMGGQTYLTVTAALSGDYARDRNTVDIALTDSTDIYFSQPTQVGGEFPIPKGPLHTIDAFPASLVVVTVPDGSDFNAGDVDRSVFEFTLPSNGYASDELDRLQLTNIGSVEDRNALGAMKLWSDVTGDGFTPDDQLSGIFSYNSGNWELTNIGSRIPAAGQAFAVTVSIKNAPFESGTLQLELATGTCRYSSGLRGPDDLAITASEIRIYPADRITVISVPQASTIIAPGSSPVGLMSFALYNGYGGQAQSLEAITFANNTRSVSGTNFRDHELGQVSLLHDADNNRLFDDDPIIASGYFTNGRLHFSGLGIDLAADSLTYFFVTAAVPHNLIDSDSLDIVVPGPADLFFGQPVVTNGDLPLQSGGYRIVDGSATDQYEMVDLIPSSLSPGDTTVAIFAFKPAINGDQIDTLSGLEIVNLGDADSTDISAMELWLDIDADELLGDGDSLLGVFSKGSDNGWTIDNLDWAVPISSATLFVVADIDAAATPGTSIRVQLPTGGCTYVSANDGPTDGPLSSDDIFHISASGLGIAYRPLDASYTIGQTIAVRFSATNRLGGSLSGVVGRLVSYQDSSAIVADSSTAGPVTLASGETTQFVYYYTAATAGTISFRTQAIATVSADSSSILNSNTATTQQLPTNVDLEFTNSIPTAVTKGQTNVFPFSLSLIHPGVADSSASVRLDSLRLNIGDGQGGTLSADDVFSRLVLSAGYTSLTVVDAVPHSSSLTMHFVEPVIVSAGDEAQFSLLVDIDSLAVATNFSFSLPDATAFAVVDANNAQAVAIDPGVIFPISTASCRVDNPSQLMAVTYESLVGPAVNYGQDHVDLLRIDLRHPGLAGSSQIQLTDVAVQFLDSAGAPVVASDLIDNLRLKKHSTVIAELDGVDLDTNAVAIQLGLPVTLGPGETESITITASIDTTTLLSDFSLSIPDSLNFVVRDLSSGSSLATTTDTSVLATGSTFPMETSQVALQLAAVAPTVCLTSMVPASTVGGVDSLELIELDLQYPVSAGYSSLSLGQILVTLTDTLGAPLDPAHLFDRLGYRDPSGIITYQQFVLTESGAAKFQIGASGLLLSPGDSLSLTLIGDISIGSAVDHFSLAISSADDLGFVDLTDTSSSLGVENLVSCSETLPFATEATFVYQPAGQPQLSQDVAAARVAHVGETDVVFFRAELDYDNPVSQGDVNLNGLRGQLWKRTASGLIPAEMSSLLNSLTVYVSNVAVATDSVPTGDSLSMAFDDTVTIQQGDRFEITLKGDIAAASAIGNYVVSFADSTWLDLTDANLATPIVPNLAGAVYPLNGAEISVVPSGLEQSFSNYPNPFNPDVGPTTIAYVLEQDAQVDIELFTITGDLVKQVALRATRSAGSNQVDTWSGKNGTGLYVVPGTYFCRIIVTYADGSTETIRRKVALIR